MLYVLSQRIRRSVASLLCLLFCLALLFSCDRQQQNRLPTSQTGVVERVGNVAVLRLEAPAFTALSRDDQIAAHYLQKAVLAGRDIVYDQLHPRHLEFRRFFEMIHLNINYGIPDYAVKPFRQYLKLFWLHNGFYNLHTLRKLTCPLGDREINQLMFTALSNSGGALGDLNDINLKRVWLIDHIYNRSADSVLFYATPPGNIDPVATSLTHFYQGVSGAEATEFKAKYPRTSRLVKDQDRLAEWVFRTGTEELAPGPYADHLQQIIQALQEARPYLTPPGVEKLDYLLEHFRTGDPSCCEAAARLNCRASSENGIDFILSFSDTRYDPLHQKGLFTGMVFISDDSAQLRLQETSEVVQNQLSKFPGYHERFFPQNSQPLKAVQLLTAVGAQSPICPSVYRDPPLHDSGTSARRTLLFTNVMAARATFEAQQLLDYGYLDSSEFEAFSPHAAEVALVKTMLREVLTAHPSESEQLPFLQPTDRDVLQVALRECALYWLLRELELVQIGIFADSLIALEAYRNFTREYALQLRAPRSSSQELPHLMWSLLGGYLTASGNAVEMQQFDNRVICRLRDAQALQNQFGELGGRLRNLLLDGSDEEIKSFLDKYLSSPPTGIEPATSREAAHSAYLEDPAFLFPIIKAPLNPMGGIKDVYLEYPADLVEEMLIFSGWDVSVKKK
ncbi:MAG: hypothetical protein ABH878_05855 [bacterium]